MSDDSYPRAWIFDEDGPTVSGTHAYFDSVTRDGREIALHVLDVNGTHRSLWVGFWSVPCDRIAEELDRRPSGNLDPGETVTYTRGREKVTSQNGRKYWPWEISFENAGLYKRSPREIFRPRGIDAAAAAEDAEAEDAEADDGIPF